MMTRVTRTTEQRKAIFAILQGDSSHPTAEAIYLKVKQQMPHISLGTVYRNLKMLADQGLISEIPVAEGPARYDFRTDHHYHFICDQCGYAHDVEMSLPTTLSQNLQRNGYTVRAQQILFYGLCPACKAKN
jgi:Fur family peroxide stress response transcriptional regulator